MNSGDSQAAKTRYMRCRRKKGSPLGGRTGAEIWYTTTSSPVPPLLSGVLRRTN